ncbi:MAG: helix-turn-helix domain-containing protein [Acidimicrobiia bacterium]
MNEDRVTLTVEEAAQVLGISRAFAYTLAKRGQLPNIRLGRRLVVPKAALEKLLMTSVELPAVTTTCAASDP